MNVILAASIWLLSFLVSSHESQSRIKQSYPDLELVELARERFLLASQGVNEDAAGLVAGLTIGIRDGIGPEATEQMKTLSLTHLVAVSGANLAIVLAAVYFLLAGLGLGRIWRFGLGLVAMLAYVLLVGPESSVIRAGTMALFVMLGLWLGRGSPPLNSLALAVIVLLVFDPGLSRDIGFALSSLATAGLLLVAQPLFEKLRTYLPDVLALGVAASAAAQLFTMPVLLILQPSLPVYSVLANVLVEPVVAPITILGILSVVVAWFSIPVAGAVGYLASLLSNWILIVARELSSLPEARLHFMPGIAGVSVLSLTVLLVALSFGRFRNHAKSLQAAALLVVIFGLSASAFDRIRYEAFDSNWEVVNCDVGQGDALLIRSAGRIALIDVGPDPELIDRCLENLGVNQIDLLVLTHFDKDHVGGIRGALEGRTVEMALISGFADDRPLVSVVEDSLSDLGVRAQIGRAGLHGKFGAGSWRVLSPSGDAREAQDSNDASVVMAFEFNNWSLLALGDLGESAQEQLMRRSMPVLDLLAAKTLVVKVAHHGSADQSSELARRLRPEYAVFSVGRNNYGHPTSRALNLYGDIGSQLIRTDRLGPVALVLSEAPKVMVGGKLSW